MTIRIHLLKQKYPTALSA